jgi:hypothetical protein
MFAGLIPGANTSGMNIAVPYQAQQGGQASLGGNLNPLLPINTNTSTSMPTLPQGAVSTSATSGMPAPMGYTTTPSYSTAGPAPGTLFGANTGGGVSGTGTPGTPGTNDPSSLLGFGSNLNPSQMKGLGISLNKTFGSGIGGLIMNFLLGGAGYNQTAVNNLVAGLQPQFERSQQDLLQQFSAGGNRFGSGAQTGFADLLSQQNLQVGELESQMYEQSVNNFMQVLLGAGSADATRIMNTPSTFDNILATLSALKPPALPVPA